MLDIKVKRNEKKCYDGGRKVIVSHPFFRFKGIYRGRCLRASHCFSLITANDMMRERRKEFRDVYEEVDHHLSCNTEMTVCIKKHTKKNLGVLDILYAKSGFLFTFWRLFYINLDNLAYTFFISMCKKTVNVDGFILFFQKIVRTFLLFILFKSSTTSDFSSHSIVCCTILLSLADTIYNKKSKCMKKCSEFRC